MLHHATSVVAPLVLTASLLAAPEAAETAQQTEPAPWLRLIEDGDVLELQAATRTYEPAEGEGPAVHLAAAIHIADPRYYANLQEQLDAHDLVLFEGVSPAGAEAETPADEAGKIEQSEDRLRLVAIILEQHKLEHGRYPASLDELHEALEAHKRAQGWLEIARTDAWGEPLVYTYDEETGDFTLLSLGSDREPGGEAAAADLAFADQEPLTDAELGVEPGIQKRLADALRLSFQVDEMDENKPNWRNADMTIRQIQDRLDARGGDAEILFSMLDGSGFQAQMAAMLLSFIERMPGMAQRGRLMIMEMLAVADEALAANSAVLGEELMTVILQDRDEFVLKRLAESIDEMDPGDDIGVIYGAGHMPGIEEGLTEKLGYELADEQWQPAIKLNLKRAGITNYERIMMRNMLQQQLQMMNQQQN